ncbi:hypothetical protein PLICRDRAFT_51830 [Plicaturopsis crispa FD-325 SS-3]|nr:hypothetical protein PLICRDRAFT_51830 [Plicaturopsis crispa FD-325 SS-3]
MSPSTQNAVSATHFVVHKFTLATLSATPSQTSAASAALQAGRVLIQQASTATEGCQIWRSLRNNPRSGGALDGGRIYAFNASLPDVSRPADAGGYALKEWDATSVPGREDATRRRGADNGLNDKDDALADDSRISTLDELEEFQNTDLYFLFHGTSVSDACQPKPTIATRADSSAREHLSRSNTVETPKDPNLHSSRSHSPRHTAPPPSQTADEGIDNEGGHKLSTRPPGEDDQAAAVERDEAWSTRVKRVSFEEHVPSAAELSVPPAGENPEASQPPQLCPSVPQQDDPSSPLHPQASMNPREQESAPHTLTVQHNLDVSSLHNIIPQPHFYPRPRVPFPLSPEPDSTLPEEIDPNVSPISPHTLASARAHLLTPYARSAWIIPLRGVLPWNNATTAVVVRSNTVPLPTYPRIGTGITWTWTSARALWTFLISIREAANMGPISLSFHAAPSHRHTGTSTASTSLPSFHRQQFSTTSTSKAPDASKASPPSVADVHAYRTGLLATDHIKIYHDAAYAMSIRRALSAWTYSTDGEEGPTDTRPLEDVRLVLLDERSKGILIL